MNSISPQEVKTGTEIRVHERLREPGEEKSRIQVFQGLVIRAHGSGVSRTITVRKASAGIGIEKIFPIYSPVLEKIELVRTYRTRRKQLTYMRHHPKRLKEVVEK